MDPLNTPVDSVFFPDIGFHVIFLFQCEDINFLYFWACVISPGFLAIQAHKTKQLLSQDKAHWPNSFEVS